MRRLPALLVLLVSLSALAAPLVQAASPTSMGFNGQPSSDVRTQVTAASMDGVGRFAAVSLADAPTAIPDAPDTSVWNLQSGGQAWTAVDDDIVNEGAKLVKVANGTSGSGGDWVVTVNRTQANLDVVAGYRTGGGCNLCRLTWLYNGTNGQVNGLDVNTDGKLIALASGTAATQNASYILLANQFGSAPPKELYRVNALSNPDPDLGAVSRFTSVALSMNNTVPIVPDGNKAVVAIVGAETTSVAGVRGAVFVFQSTFGTSDLNHPDSKLIQRVITDTAVTSVDITADGEYAVAGTSGGQVYLISVGEALERRGVNDVEPPLRPAQQSVGDAVTNVAIAKFGSGRVFAVGTQSGDVVLFRNDQAPSRSEGASAREVRRTSVTGAATGCNPQLTGPVSSLAFTNYGEQLVVGAKNGLLEFDAGPFAEFGGDVFAPSWCIPYDSGHTGDAGVRASISGDGKRVFAGTSHFVFGYTNFYHVSLSGGQQAQPGIPGGRTQWAITVTNDGSLFDRLNLTIAGPQDPGWTFDLSNRSLLLFPGRSQTVLVNATTPATISPGNFSLTFSVNPEKDPGNVPTQTLRLDIGQLRRVELRPPTGTLIASAGSENTFPIVVHNGGNALDRFRVTAAIPEPQEQFKSPGSDWAIRVDPSVIDIAGGQDATVNLIVAPSAQRGDTALIQLQVQPEVPSAGSEGVIDVQQVTVAVEPTFGGDVSLADTNRNYQLYPGQSIFVNFTVKNLGNSRDIFTVSNHTDPANAPGWRLQLTDTRFELRTQGASHVVRMTVTGQLGLQPGDSVRAILDVYSDGQAKQTPGSDGKVDEQSVTITVIPQPKTKFLGVPALAEPLVLLGVLGAALLAQRRRA